MELKIKQTIKELESLIELIQEEALENNHASDTSKIKQLVEFWEGELLKL